MRILSSSRPTSFFALCALLTSLVSLPLARAQAADDPASAYVHEVAIARPHTLIRREEGKKLESAPDDVIENARQTLIKALVRHMPGGARARAPLPHELGDDYEKALCHNLSLLTDANLMAQNNDYREKLKNGDGLKYILEKNDPLCEFEPYHESDAILYSALIGLESDGARDTALLLGNIVLMGMVPLPMRTAPFEGVQVFSVLVENRTHRVLASDFQTGSYSLSEDHINEITAKSAKCFLETSGMRERPKPPRPMMVDDFFGADEITCPGFRLFHPYRLHYTPRVEPES